MSINEQEGPELLALLGEFFPAEVIEWKPQSVSGSRALAIAYIDARAVMDRLDEVMGPGNWADDYVILEDGSALCKLSLRLGGEWITKHDVGSESDQPDAGDRRKASVSDALKRAAVKWGVGRYLYRLPAQWVDWDPQKKRFAKQPQLPAQFLPRGHPDKPPPDFATLLADCQTEEQLVRVGRTIAEAKLRGQARDLVARLYAQRLKFIRATGDAAEPRQTAQPQPQTTA